MSKGIRRCQPIAGIDGLTQAIGFRTVGERPRMWSIGDFEVMLGDFADPIAGGFEFAMTH